jgi:hypothetical protein
MQELVEDTGRLVNDIKRLQLELQISLDFETLED